jgi:starch synthase (maltosyl-transferring)
MGTRDGRRRVLIEGISPEVDDGRFAVKRVVGERVLVEADVFADSHDVISCVLLYRREADAQWNESPMRFIANDRWQGEFRVTQVGIYYYTLQAWIDLFRSWCESLVKKVEAGQDVCIELLVGAALIEVTSKRAAGSDVKALREQASLLRLEQEAANRIPSVLDDDFARLMAKYPDKKMATTYDRELRVTVDRERARFSAWYEMFPRSCTPLPTKHGTFRGCKARLSYIAGMGFDVLYFPPIHSIGHTHRKGKNNSPTSGPNDPGSPWAIGSEEGGHRDIHPELGSLDDFRDLVSQADAYGIEIAIDLAFQCTPDHPYVKTHPEWLRWRPDGTVQYAENPPKKYEDIFPLNFETDNWEELWEELKGVVLFWIEQGIRIFRVDNPHTKPFSFWEWIIGEVKKDHPEVFFLAEAFTRPKVMVELAKLGFTQSYTYFAWRNTKRELIEYFTELTQTEVREFFRPNLWPNTPDILTEYLQTGGRPAFMARLVLAATLGANYGIYGPAFELCEIRPREFGSEEYLDSEKYEIKAWDLNREDSLKDFIARVNRIRQENPALHRDWNLRFHPVDNEQLICYSKHTEDLSNILLVVVNLDPHHTHTGWLDLPLQLFGLDPNRSYQVHDLLDDARYLWYGSRGYVEINPKVVPAHIFRVRRRIRTELDFDYFT